MNQQALLDRLTHWDRRTQKTQFTTDILLIPREGRTKHLGFPSQKPNSSRSITIKFRVWFCSVLSDTERVEDDF